MYEDIIMAETGSAVPAEQSHSPEAAEDRRVNEWDQIEYHQSGIVYQDGDHTSCIASIYDDIWRRLDSVSYDDATSHNKF